MKKVIYIYLLLFGSACFAQQSAKGFFDNGAKEFVYSKLEKAIATVDKGLQQYPTDAPLLELKEKLEEAKKKKEQQQNSENKDQNKDKDQNQDKDKNKDQNQDKNKDQNQDKNKDQNEDKNQNQDKEKDKKEGKDEKKPSKPQLGKMSPAQMQQLLETMRNEEQKTQKKVNAQKVKGPKRTQEKDW
ncbi:MAG: hypothetical protein ACPHXR_02675 [Flavicella sp.]